MASIMAVVLIAGVPESCSTAFFHPLACSFEWGMKLLDRLACLPASCGAVVSILGSGFSASDSPLLPLLKCLPQESIPRCRWKTQMLMATPLLWRKSPHRPPGCHHHRLGCHHHHPPRPTPLRSHAQPQQPSGHLALLLGFT